MPFRQRCDASNALAQIIRLPALQGRQGYVVGGFIRDLLLGRSTNDIDIAVSGDALTVAREVATQAGGTFVRLDEVNRIARVVKVEDGLRDREARGQEWHFDFSALAQDIEADLGRRDFTINAMALELTQFATADTSTGEVSPKAGDLLADRQLLRKLIDPFSGSEDLRDKVIRKVSDHIFEVDAVRLLRAVRLAAELDFTIEPDTEALIRSYSPAITGIPGERIREELLRLLGLPRAATRLRYLDDLGLLTSLIPELAEARGVEQPTAHFWDVFEHSLQTVAASEFLMRESDWEHGDQHMRCLAPWSDDVDRHLSQEVSGGSNHRTLVKLGALLHDIAKPVTKTVDDTGRARFLGHTKQGAALTAGILERLRFSNREINLVESLVYHHLRPAQMAHEGLPTQRAIYRYFRDTGEAGIDVLLLALADYLASRGPLVSIQEWAEQCRATDYILAEHDRQEADILTVKLITGYDIMHGFGLAPGPLIGKLLARVREAQASGELRSREEALDLVREELSATPDRQQGVRGNSQDAGPNSNDEAQR